MISLSKLQVTCLDEADEMLKQGFQEDIERIFDYIEKHTPRKTQNLLFSATIPSWVVDLSRKYLSSDRKYVDLIKDSDIRTSKTVEHLADRLALARQLQLPGRRLQVITALQRQVAGDDQDETQHSGTMTRCRSIS